MLKLLFSLTPGWIKDVERNGATATATILSDPQQVMKSVKGYQGKDAWIEVMVRVEAGLEPAFESKMKCKLSQAVFGMLETGMQVNVRYDRKDHQRVLLVDDVNTLLSYRLKN
jgi:hypothetical protein